jgi:hypothetical protein
MVRARQLMDSAECISCRALTLHKLQYEIRKPIPKGPGVINSVYLQNYWHAVFIYKQNKSSTWASISFYVPSYIEDNWSCL